MFSFPSKLYPITDSRLSGFTHADQVAKLAAGGAHLVQVREKNLDPRKFLVIINDRVDIVLAVGAAGVHLGQDDLPPESARRLLGSEAIIGFSTHSTEQARLAARLPISYLAFGPIFATTSKKNPDAVVGIEALKRVRDIVRDVPLVAIGGITQENAAEVIAAGADAVAVISALYQQPSQIPQTIASFHTILNAAPTL
jgi:thiamine-phosphate pyrophosphorylase